MTQSVIYSLEDISKMMKILNSIQISGVDNLKAIAVIYDTLAKGKAIQHEAPNTESISENFSSIDDSSTTQEDKI